MRWIPRASCQDSGTADTSERSGPAVSAALRQSGPCGPESAPRARQHLTPRRLGWADRRCQGKSGKTKAQPQARAPRAGLSVTETSRWRACTLNSLAHRKNLHRGNWIALPQTPRCNTQSGAHAWVHKITISCTVSKLQHIIKLCQFTFV